MALKDWKKVKETTNYIQYDKSESLTLMISRSPEDTGIFRIMNKYNKDRVIWNALLSNEYNQKLWYTFKTKSQALRFAKAYMRTH
jgi:hypothetical protein